MITGFGKIKIKKNPNPVASIHKRNFTYLPTGVKITGG
jgi:hypothetical protein